MIVFKDKSYMTISDKPNEDWTNGEAIYVIEDNTTLANKLKSLFPYYDFVLKDGKLIDVVETDKPKPTLEELQYRYDALSIKYIHEKYSYDDENKIIREYLSDMHNEELKNKFNEYNEYVKQCKQKSYDEVYN